jgi:uncharacterized protein YggE
MSDPTTISVRGEARHVVPPDFAVLALAIVVREADKQAALDRAGRAQTAVADLLRDQGGVTLTIESIDAPLTWATQSFTAHPDEEWDERKGRRQVGWRVHVPVSVTLRQLARLDDVAAALSAVPDLEVHQVDWQVDPHNPAWPVVRAAAIADAIGKARDYAAALHGEVTALVHVADAGLLGGQEHPHYRSSEASAAAGLGFAGGAPALDPAPLEISAVIEARFQAQIAQL